MSQTAVQSPAVEQWQTKDREDFHAAMTRWFPGIGNFSFAGAPKEFGFEASTLTLDTLRIMRHSCSGTRFDFPMFETMCLNVSLQGHSSYTTRKSDVRSKPCSVAVTQHGERVSVGLSPDYAGLVLIVAASALLEQAGRLLGCDGARSLQDLGAGAVAVNVETGPGAALVRGAYGALKDAEQLSEMGLGALIRAQTYDHLANLLLVAAVPKVRERLQCDEKSAGPRAIAQARAYLEAHAGQPVRMSLVAERLGISLRALQHGFRKQFGKSPLEFLIERRLQNARAQLLSAAPGISVTSVALDSGFANVGAFAGRYRLAFGELPSETLAGRRPR